MKYRAQFKGKEGSLGYSRGKLYTLDIWQESRKIIIRSMDNPRGACVYSNLYTFFDNWSIKD